MDMEPHEEAGDTDRTHAARSVTRRHMLRLIAAGGAIATVSPLLLACGGDSSTPTTSSGASTNATSTSESSTSSTPSGSAPSGNRGGTLIFASSTDADSLDPNQTGSAVSSRVFENLFDPLIGYDEKGAFEPIVSEKWEVADDGLTYTFTIRDGLKFHNGDPLTPDAVKFTFNWELIPEVASQNLSTLGPFTGAETGENNTVTLTLSEPFGPFLSAISTSYSGILPPGPDGKLAADFGTKPVGSGPWIFKEWVKSDHITLSANKDYHNYRSWVQNKGAPYADELTFRVIPEAQTQLAALQTGEVNILIPTPHDAKTLQDDDNYQVVVSPTGDNNYWIGFALLPSGTDSPTPEFNPPFDDIKLRQAVGYAVNPDEVIATVLEGFAQRNIVPQASSWFSYDPDAVQQYSFSYDVDKAKSLLDEAGWVESGGTRKKDGKELSVVWAQDNDPTNEQVAQVFQNQLAQVGFKVDIRVLDFEVLHDWVKKGTDYHLTYHGSTWPDPDEMHYRSQSDYNALAFYHPKEYMDALVQARQVSDNAERTKFYTQASEIMLKDAVNVPLWTIPPLIVVRKDVTGFKFGPHADNDFVDASVSS